MKWRTKNHLPKNKPKELSMSKESKYLKIIIKTQGYEQYHEKVSKDIIKKNEGIVS